MAQQAPLHNKRVLIFILASCLFLLQCKQKKQDTDFLLKPVDAAKATIKTTGGVTYINDTAATAFIYSLYPSGDTAFAIPYTNGKQHGFSKLWYDNKQLKEIRNFDNGAATGEAKGWWPTGQQKFIYHFANDVYEGNVKEWGSSGKLYKDMHYKNGQEEGEQKLWYDNGQLRSNYLIKNGRRYGLLGTKNCINVSDSIFNKP